PVRAFGRRSATVFGPAHGRRRFYTRHLTLFMEDTNEDAIYRHGRRDDRRSRHRDGPVGCHPVNGTTGRHATGRAGSGRRPRRGGTARALRAAGTTPRQPLEERGREVALL